MSEWRTIDSDEGSYRSGVSFRLASSRQLIRIGVGLILLALTVFGILRYQRAERQQALREDLKAHIFQEETERFLGHQDQIDLLIMADAPPAWQQAYRRNYFNSSQVETPPGPIDLYEVEFDGRCALATLNLAGQAQIRYYCLDQVTWRRAPIPETAWGESETATLQNGMSLRFRARDRRFAQTLLTDLNRFFETLDQYGVGPVADEVGLFEIVIEPQELQGVTAQALEEESLVLNSPWLVASPELSGEGAIRLPLATVLLRRINPDVPDSLPGGYRFQYALQSIIAMQLMLSPEDQAHRLNAWRSELYPEWISPFFAEFINPDRSDLELYTGLTAFLTAQYIYDQEGILALLKILKELPEASSWDHLFQSVIGRSTLKLEQEVARYAYAQTDGAGVPDLGVLPAGFPPSLKGTLSQLETHPPGKYRAYLDLPDQDWPLPVELPAELMIRTSGGNRLPPGCVTPGTPLEVKGEWLEAGRRLAATEVSLQGEIIPLELGPAPADTIAYLIQGEAVEPEEPATNQAQPAIYSALKPNYLSAYRTLIALRANGILHSLFLLKPTMRVFPLPMSSDGHLQFLFILKLEGCDRAWFVHYRPDQGVVGQWLAPPEPMQWLWRADKQDLIFFGLNPRSLVYEIYRGGPTFWPELLETVDIPLLFVGWNTQTGRLVSNVTRFQETYLGLFDMASRDISFRPHNNPLRYFTLSPSGNWLAYLNRAQGRGGPLQRLEALNMSDRSEAVLLAELTGDYAFRPPVWSMNLNDSKIAVLGGPVASDRFFPSSKWLILADPNYPKGTLPLIEARDGESLAYPVFCADDSILYRVDREGQYQLRRYAYRFTPPQTLATLNWSFQPLACP